MTDPQNAAPQNAQIHAQLGRKYDAGFITDIETDSLPPGLSEDIIRALSAKKHEPEWMTQWRLAAYRHWQTMPNPEWAKLNIPPIDYQDAYYYAAPKAKPTRLSQMVILALRQSVAKSFQKTCATLHGEGSI